MPIATGHKFRACCGFPFVETSCGNQPGVIRVQLWPNTWGGDPDEKVFQNRPAVDYDNIDIRCSRCGDRAMMVENDAHTPHQLGVDKNGQLV